MKLKKLVSLGLATLMAAGILAGCSGSTTSESAAGDSSASESTAADSGDATADSAEASGEEKTILFGLTGTGYFDMVAYEKFHDGLMTDYVPTDEDIQASLSELPKVDL